MFDGTTHYIRETGLSQMHTNNPVSFEMTNRIEGPGAKKKLICFSSSFFSKLGQSPGVLFLLIFFPDIFSIFWVFFFSFQAKKKQWKCWYAGPLDGMHTVMRNNTIFSLTADCSQVQHVDSQVGHRGIKLSTSGIWPSAVSNSSQRFSAVTTTHWWAFSKHSKVNSGVDCWWPWASRIRSSVMYIISGSWQSTMFSSTQLFSSTQMCSSAQFFSATTITRCCQM